MDFLKRFGDSSYQDNHNLVPRIVIFVLTVAVAFNLWHLYPEVTDDTLAVNDSVFHWLLAGSAVEALTNGKDVTDPWQRTMSLGFPNFHYYQHLPHIAVAFIHFLTLEAFTVFEMMRWTTYLLLSLFPLSIYWSLRKFDFDPLIAAMGGVVASLIGTDFGEFGGMISKSYGGFGYSNYIFQGWGLYSQLWAMVLLPPALAMSYRALVYGRGYCWAVLLLVATLMSHLMYGYIAFLALGALSFVSPVQEVPSRSFVERVLSHWKRLIFLFLAIVITTSYFLVPFFLDQEYFNTSVFTAQEITDSVGHQMALEALVKGNLFDWGRFPSVSILVFVGIALCIVLRKERRYLIPLLIFFLFFLLFFGRSTWGPFVEVLPFNEYLHMHRFIGGVHLGGIFLAGIALGILWRWAVSQKTLWPLLSALAVTLLLVSPLYTERRSYLSQNSARIEQSHRDLSAEYEGLLNIVEVIKSLPPGRVYAGTVGGQGKWGDAYRVNCPEVRSNCIPVYVLLQAEGLDVMSYPYHGYSLASDVLADFDATRLEQYNLFNVRYVVAPEDQWVPDFMKLLHQFGRHGLYEVPTTGYFDLVGSDLAFSGRKTDFYPAASTWLASHMPNSEQYPKVSIDPSDRERKLSHPFAQVPEIISNTQSVATIHRGEILSEKVGTNFFAASVDVLEDSLLVLKTSYHPNWRVTVDGMDALTTMVMPGFIGVELPFGKHEILIEYQSRAIRKILLGLGVVVLVLIPIGEGRGGAFSYRLATKVLRRVPGSMRIRQTYGLVTKVVAKIPAPMTMQRTTRADRRRRRRRTSR